MMKTKPKYRIRLNVCIRDKNETNEYIIIFYRFLFKNRYFNFLVFYENTSAYYRSLIPVSVDRFRLSRAVYFLFFGEGATKTPWTLQYLYRYTYFVVPWKRRLNPPSGLSERMGRGETCGVVRHRKTEQIDGHEQPAAAEWLCGSGVINRQCRRYQIPLEFMKNKNCVAVRCLNNHNNIKILCDNCFAFMDRIIIIGTQ